MSNSVRNARDLRRFCWLCVVFAVIIFGLSIPNLSAAWSAGFTNNVLTFGVMDLNGYGFLFVLLFCATAPLWLIWKDVFRGLVVGGGLAAGALISLSRSAWANLLIAVAIIFVLREFKGSRGRVRRAMTLLLAMSLAGLAIRRVSQARPGAAQFGEQKVSDFEDDAVNTRLVQLTLNPIGDWLQQPVPTLIIGDAASFQHTFLANALWFTGIAGLICGLGIYLSLMVRAWHAWRRSRNSEHWLTAACFLAVVVAMVFDDSATNHRYHSQMLSYLFFSTTGAFTGSLRKIGRTAALPVRMIGGKSGTLGDINVEDYVTESA